MKKIRQIMAMFMALFMTLLMPFVGYADDDVESINMYDGYLTIDKEFTTTDAEEDGRDLFEDTYTDDNVLYNLVSITTEIVNEDIIEGESMVYNTPRAGSEEELEEPAEIIVTDGINFVLVSKELIETTTPGETTHVQQEVTFQGLDTIESIPSYAEITVTDLSGNELTENFPFLGIESEEEVWVDNFEFPILFTGYDADIIYLNGTEIDKDADLTIYEHEFLEYLGLPESDYTITSVTWDGPEYTQNGTVYRQATARGSKLQRNVVALYGGDIVLGDQHLFHYECVYVEADDDGNELRTSVYTVRSTARYDMEETIEEAEPLEPEVPSTDKNIFQRLAEWIRDNPVAAMGVGTLILVIVIVIVLFIVSRRRKAEDNGPEIIDFDNKFKK